MARIRSISPSSQTVSAHPTEVDCEWAVVDGPDGHLLHLTTFGSDERESARKSSQSVRLDREQAGELVQIIRRVFPGPAR